MPDCGELLTVALNALITACALPPVSATLLPKLAGPGRFVAGTSGAPGMAVHTPPP